MNTHTTGELRPQSVRILNLAGKTITAGDALYTLAEQPHIEGTATVTRLEAVIELLCDVAVDLGGMVEAMREGGR